MRLVVLSAKSRHVCTLRPCFSWFLWVVVAQLALAGCEAYLPPEDLSKYLTPPGKYDVRILRDAWGVPHVFGARDADVAYGLGYAHSEDDWINMEDAVLVSRARLASVRGRELAKFDYLVHLFRVREFVNEKYENELSASFREVVEAYADGITHYAALHRDKMPHIGLPVTGKDIVAGATLKLPFFYDLQDELVKLLGAKGGVPISRKGVVGRAIPAENPLTDGQTIGSNCWAVGPSRSADGAVRLAVNSHMPWEGPVAFYEAHLHSEEGWNMVGATFPGGVVVFMGHDEAKGWCHTISRPDLADAYALELNPENPYQYRFDGEWRDLERGAARIKVRLWGRIAWTFERELLWSVHGPVFRGSDGLFAVRFAGYGEIRSLEQWYRMNKAKNLEEFREAMRMLAVPSFNTLYADRAGDLFYAYNGQFPVRAEGYNWRGCLPGTTSKTVPGEVLRFDALPQVLNPPSGFIQSCNSSPFKTTVGAGNPRPEDFPGWMGIETHLTNRATRVRQLYGADESITRDEFYAYKYDKTYAETSHVVKTLEELLASDIPDEPLLQEGIQLLEGWDRSTNKENPAAALAILVAERHSAWQRWGGTPFSLVNVLREATRHLEETFGRLDVPWKEMMRLRRGSLDLGLGGGPDCVRAIDPRLAADGRFVGINGDCYFLMVEWDKDGHVRSEAIHQYGAASVDQDSPHYADQAPLFVNEKMRPTLLTEEEIRAHLAREYRPGEIDGPWYAQ